jgi:hypothetical protein
MQSREKNTDKIFQPIEDQALHEALTALGRSINIISTYGTHHPAFQQAIGAALISMQTLFIDRKKINIGAFNGVMTVDETPISAIGTLLKSLERRLVRLHITSLRIAQGISEAELTKLSELLATNEIEDFNSGMSQAGLSHIVSEDTRFQAVRDDQTVANESDLAGAGGNGILVLDDDVSGSGNDRDGSGESSVNVEQIVAFLQGDMDVEDGTVSEELTELASDPTKLGQMIMESVAIRQSASELSGESLSDVVLGCLRRTYDGLRKQPAFQTSEGVADLQKALLLLEESMLDKMRNIAGESDPEVDRQIVQAIREMDENLGFELSANQYMEHRDAIEENRQHMQDYVRSKGVGVAEELISNTDFPASEWQRIVVGNAKAGSGSGGELPIAAGLNTLANVFEKLESLMKSDETDGSQVKDLLGQANDNLDGTVDSTKEKLEVLSKQLEDTGTIGGQATSMSRKELLSNIAEIAQELMQPLTAINASLEMMLGGYVGEVNPEQHTLLDLANNSGAHLTFLMKELIEIVGCPTNKGVDDRFHTTSEQVVLMEQKTG